VEEASLSEQLLTVQEMCELFQVARGFVYRHAKEMGAVNVGSHLRFRRSDVNRWIESQRLEEDPGSVVVQRSRAFLDRVG
jgi:excisionase family DNA binding protein